MLFYCNSKQTAGSHCQCLLFQHLLQLRLMLLLLHRHLWKMWFPALEWSSLLISEGYVFNSACIILFSSLFFSSMQQWIQNMNQLKNLLCLLFFFFWGEYRLPDFTLYLTRKRLPSQSFPKRSLILPAAKIKKPPIVTVRAHSGQKGPGISKPTTNKLICFLCSSQSACIRSRLAMRVRSSPESTVGNQQQQQQQ